MGYSEYGGHGYRNGERLDAASDAVVTPDMSNAGSPGHWPGFGPVADAMGMKDFYDLKARSVDGHVVIGDGVHRQARGHDVSLWGRQGERLSW